MRDAEILDEEPICVECGDDLAAEGQEKCSLCLEIKAYEDHLARLWEG